MEITRYIVMKSSHIVNKTTSYGIKTILYLIYTTKSVYNNIVQSLENYKYVNRDT